MIMVPEWIDRSMFDRAVELHHQFVSSQGLRPTGAHHEIYLSDVLRVAPERRRTILRQPVARAWGTAGKNNERWLGSLPIGYPRAEGLSQFASAPGQEHDMNEHEDTIPADNTREHDGRDLDQPVHRRDEVVANDEIAREKFGGLNIGAAFFGWIVAIGVAILLAGIVGAVLAGLGSSVEITQSDAERKAGAIGLSTAIVLLVILALAYYAGGYVAGRMSRFDGARQGVGVWVLGLIVTIVAIALGAFFGDQYNVLDRVDLPRIPISTDQLGWGAVMAGVAVVLVTLMSAVLGGALGHRYHHRVDRAVRP